MRSIRKAGRGASEWLVLCAALWALSLVAPANAAASPVEIVHAAFQRTGDAWRVSVTLRHADSGWDHYADLWVLEDEQGHELGRRVLLHPHVDEQPFTRSQTVSIAADVSRLRIRAGDNVDGLNSAPLPVDLSQPAGERYRVHP